MALDSVGYMWTFVIFACIAATGKSEAKMSSNFAKLGRYFIGGFSVLFYPEEITSEYFRETFELKQTDLGNHVEESKEDAVSDIDDGYYSRK